MDGRIWTYKKINESKLSYMVEKLNINPVTARVLINRGIDEVAAAEVFLNPTLLQLYDPYRLKDMDKVVERIKAAISRNESIWIYGDYDVDGVSSTSLLVRYFKDIGYPVNYYIPHRMDEGYGLNFNALEDISKNGGQLIITVDCGITSVNEVAYASSLGMDVIITDHHECQGQLPPAYGIINPKQADCQYPYKSLCGCGIALKLVQALTPPEVFLERVNNYIDIAALATVADIVPLLEENRIIVKNGLEVINNTANCGIRALIEVSGLKGKKINAGNIGFMLAPRLNAAGRIGHAEVGVKLLTTEDAKEAMELAKYLDDENKHRQQLEIDIYNSAVEMVEAEGLDTNRSFLVLHSEGWHHGVIGIVASRIVEKYYKPTVILSIEDGIAKGSARSISGLNVFEALSQCKDLFLKFGGHEQAAGLSLEVDKLDEFMDRIDSITNSLLTEEDFLREIPFDYILESKDIKEKLIDELNILEPHGMGNPSPKFLTRGLRTTYLKAVGTDGKHLKIDYEVDKGKLSAIGFGLGLMSQQLQQQDTVDVLYTPEYNYFNGNKSIQLNLRDMRLKEEASYKRSPFHREYYKSLQLKEGLDDCFDITKPSENIIIDDKNDRILMDLLFSSNGPLLVVINTLGKANALYSLSGIRQKGMKRRFIFHYGFIENQPNEGDIHLIINPIIDKIDFRRYNKVILYDQFFSIGHFKSFIAASRPDNTYIFYQENDEVCNHKVLKDIIPCRQRLVDLYKVFVEAAKAEGQASIDEFVDGLNNKLSFYVNHRLVKNALELFHEGKLIDYSIEGNNIRLTPIKVDGKINIEALEAYKSQQNWFTHHEKYKKRIIELYMRRK